MTQTAIRPRVLFVAYSFPPVGGVGVQRVTKFIKYLPECGWNSSVLTVANPSVPLLDESLSSDIPCNTIIRRAKTLEPGYHLKQAVSGAARKGFKAAITGTVKSGIRRVANLALQPDAQVLWHRHAYRTGKKLLNEVPHDVIVATGPPFSSFLLGAKLSRASGLPLVLDYRDEWGISNAYWENKQQGRLSNWIQTRQQARALRHADFVIATTPSSLDSVHEAARWAGSSAPATYIYNGFDSDDFSEAAENTPPATGSRKRFRLAFLGTLWNLNSIQPIVQAVKKLAESNPALLGDLELLVAGRRTDDQEARLSELDNLPVQVTRLPFVSHAAAISLMRSADALLMLNSDVPRAERIINAKVFEYMAAQRPMFVVAPRGDVWNLVQDLPGTRLSVPSQTESIARNLAEAIEEWRCGVQYRDAVWEIARFHRRQSALDLAQILNDVRCQTAVENAPSTGFGRSNSSCPEA